MKAEEALKQHGKAYAVHHGDLLILWQREDGSYVIEFTDLSDSKRRGMYINPELVYVLERNKRYRAEWYCTEQEARKGNQPEEFFIYNFCLYQSYETGEIFKVKFCNGEPLDIWVINLDEEVERLREDDIRLFLLHIGEYKWLTGWFAHIVSGNERLRTHQQKMESRSQKVHYVYRSKIDGSEHEEYHESLKRTAMLIRSHFRRSITEPFFLESPKGKKIFLVRRLFLNKKIDDLVLFLKKELEMEDE